MWDQAGSARALTRALSSGLVPVSGLRAVVPGCGRGYDVASFVRAGAKEAVGIEISPTAVRVANEWLRGELGEGASASARVVLSDFFAPLSSSGLEPFDVGYDYTFFCALHPDMRADWAAGWARAIAPGGTLVALLFPVDPSRDPATGPPFPVSVELAKSLLEPAGFRLESETPVPDQDSAEGRQGKEILTLWKRV